MRSIKEEGMECPHMIKSVSTAGIRKKLKGDFKSFCHPCTFKAFESVNEHWFCLQCGNIGCGDSDAQNGDAEKHYQVPHSDLHSIVMHLEKDSKCWCFLCKMEVNSKSAHLKDAITLVKRNIKFRNTQKAQKDVQESSEHVGSKNATSASIAIPLPPPPPVITLSNGDSNRKGSFSGRNYNQNKSGCGYGSDDNSTIPRPTDKPFGLQNLGNTCFMNSALQCLASTRLLLPKLEIFGNGQELKMLVTQTESEALVTLIDNANEAEPVMHVGNGDIVNNNFLAKGDELSKPLEITLEISPDTMTGRLQHTIKAIRKDSNHSAVPAVVRESYESREFYGWGTDVGFRPRGVVELIGKHFRPGQQHDAHELLRTIVDMMKKDQTKAFRKAIMKHYGMEVGGEGSDPKLVELVKTLDQKVKHKTFVDDVFGGELMTIQTCLTCKSVKKSYEQFLDLSLPIRVVKHLDESSDNKKSGRRNYSVFDESDKQIVINKTLEDCLRAFTEPELLTGSNVVECENCHQLNLAKIEAGVPVEEVFPSFLTEKKDSPKASPPPEKSPKWMDDRKKKRPTRQQKLRNQAERERASNSTPASTTTTILETEVLLLPKSCEDNFDLIENHFELVESQGAGAGATCKTVEDPEMKVGGDSSSNQSGSLDDYVVIQSDVVKASSSGSAKRKHVEMETPDSEQEAFPAVAEKLSESLNNLNLDQLEDIESMGVDFDDFDLPPAVDGIGGSASDGEVDNGVPHLALDLPSYDKFESFQLSEPDMPSENYSETEKPATADEGFSEGENSASLENETGHQQERSQASSRNSISDPDELNKSSGSGTQDQDQETEKESPRVSISESEEEVPIVVEPPKIPKVTRCPCSRQQTISRPPEFLTLHLKRFQMSYGGSAIKVSHSVSFPLTLDLTPFCFPVEDESSTVFDEEGQVLYSLYGLVEHSGSINWGHYTANVKTEDDKWFHISDSHVSACSAQATKNTAAYILFYERVRSVEEKRRLSVAEPEEPEKEKPEEDIWASWDDESHRTPAVTTTATSWHGGTPPELEDWDKLPNEPSTTSQPVEWNTTITEPAEVGVECWSDAVSTGIEWGSGAQVLEWNDEDPLKPEIEVTSEGFSEATSESEQKVCVSVDSEIEILGIPVPQPEFEVESTPASTESNQFPIKEEELMDTL